MDRSWLAFATLLLPISALALDPPTLTIGAQSVRLEWEAEPLVVLQESRSLQAAAWHDVPSTLNKAVADLPRANAMRYYRLVQRSTSYPLLNSMKERVVEHVIDRIHFATLPPGERGEAQVGLLRNSGRGDASVPATSSRAPFTWTSQPGMIRTFGADPDFLQAYPLYSTTAATLDSKEALAAEIAHLSGWQDQPEGWTDLNAPNGSVYPILDPAAITEHHVEGLSAAEGVSMPVRWLYVLADGNVGTLDAEGQFVGEDGAMATEENPMVTRVAYWTDDESCKININTASEAIPWDKPRTWSPEDRAYGIDQPLSNEFQRHPGHPATTSLSAILYPGRRASDGGSPLTDEELQRIYDLAPRAQWHEPSEDKVLPQEDTALYQNNDHFPEALNGLITTHSAAPETTLHGRPRMSVWPVHEEDSTETRSADDLASAQAASLNGTPYYFQRAERLSSYHDFYSAAGGHNRDLYLYVMDQVYRDIPSVGGSLAQKYGGMLEAFDYTDAIEYKLDHPLILLQMFDYIRQTNLIDGRIARPFAPMGDRGGFGQVTGLSLLGRDLYADAEAVEAAHLERWHEPTLEPRASGRDYTLSELAIVIYNVGEVTIKNFKEGKPTFSAAAGFAPTLEPILSNEHPHYADYRGRSYGEEDVGHTFKLIEVGLIPEFFSVAEGHHLIHPSQTIRLLTGGTSYRGGTSAELGIRINGIPLNLWGDSLNLPDDLQGPGIMTIDPDQDANGIRANLPAGWNPVGGPGGYRLMQFGRFEISNQTSGYVRDAFLSDGKGPLSKIYTTAPVAIRDDEKVVITQDAPLQFALYDNTGADATQSEIAQTINVRMVEPGSTLVLPAPARNSGSYQGWTRRFRSAAAANARTRPVFVLEPGKDRELVTGYIPAHGDYRHISTRRHVPSELYRHHPATGRARASHSLTWAVPKRYSSIARHGTFSLQLHRRSLANVNYDDGTQPDFAFDPTRDRKSEYAPLMSAEYRLPIDPALTRDFDTGTGPTPDGSYINKPDDGADPIIGSTVFNQKVPYLDGYNLEQEAYQDRALQHYVPHRMTPSPVSFGSLPSAVQANAPWTCLLFRPNVSDPTRSPHLGERGHGLQYLGDRESLEGFQIPQLASITGPKLPADHHWLDSFWMPAANPGHITHGYATAGKVNMNYQCFPFTSIKRATALHAVIKSERIMAIPNADGTIYKLPWLNHNFRLPIDATETLKQFEEKFANQDVFVSESEICEQFLIPEGQAWDADGASIREFWDDHRLSGDNLLERPYANLYPRLTTRSNAFRVHYRVQNLVKSPNTPPNTFSTTEDKIGEELRGEAVIERYLDEENAALPNYVTELDAPRVEHFFKSRVVSERSY